MKDSAPVLEQLRATVAFAYAHVPYYRAQMKRLGLGPDDVTDLDTLRWLPLLNKRQAMHHQRDLAPDRPGADLVPRLSSGTTRDGSQVLLVQTHPDDRRPRPGRVSDEEGGRTLVLPNLHHGPPAPRHDAHVNLPLLPHANAFDQVARLLSRPEDAITRLLGSVTNITALTVWLLDAGVDLTATGVRDIGTNGSLLSAPWRRRLARAWNATLWDNYSLSEIPAVATTCDRCGALHFDDMPVLLELIDPLTEKVAPGPVAELVLTTLLPDVTGFPFLRYRTGDLVELSAARCERGAGFFVLGRAADAVLAMGAAGTEVWLSPRGLLDALDDEPAVDRHPVIHEQRGVVRPGVLGSPRATVVRAGDAVTLRVAVRAPFDEDAAEVAALAARVRSRLLAAHPAQGRATRRGAALHVEVHPAPPAARWRP